MKLKYIIIGIVLIISSTVFADSVNEGNAELLIPYDGVILSMGGGAVNSPPLANLFFNPAFITSLPSRYATRFSFFSGVFDKNPISSFVLGGKVFRELFAFLEFTDYKNQSFVQMDAIGTVINESREVPNSSLVKIGLAYRFFGNLSFGFNWKSFKNVLIEEFGDETRVFFSYPSAGLTYSKGNMRVGFSVCNFARFYDPSFDDNYPTLGTVNFNGGIGLLNNTLTINGGVSGITFRDHYNVRGFLAFQYRVAGLLFLRAAATSLNPLDSALKLGMGIELKNVNLDYTFSFGEINTSHYISLGYGMKPFDKTEPVDKVKKARPAKKKKRKKPKTKFEKPEASFEKILVAVLEFEGRNIETSDAEIITDFIRQSLITSGYFKVLERGMINELLTEVNLQQSGCTSSECAVQIGKILAVKKMIVGNVSKLGKKFFINLRMVDVETSQIDFATSVGAEVPIEQLPEYAEELIANVVESLKE